MAIWTTLVAFVRRGEMSMDEARKRDNYYRFVREASYIPNPRKYVLDAQPEELPPYVSILSVELAIFGATMQRGCVLVIWDRMRRPRRIMTM